jgi:hypothetical protein
MPKHLALAIVVAATVSANGAAPPADRVPIVVELFTSEGCSDCPPADAVLQTLIATQPVASAEIIGLGEHVDYWDRLGWKDRFSSAAATSRQQQYQAHFRTESIYTPQMIVDGRAEFVGSDAAAARRAIERAIVARHGIVRIKTKVAGTPPTLQISVTTDEIPFAAPGEQADIIVALTEDRLQTEVRRGENSGRVLKHSAVVRHMATIGQAGTTTPVRAECPLQPEWRRDALTIVAFVQERRGRAIVAAAAARLENARP